MKAELEKPLALAPQEISTPAFVIYEDRVIHNLHKTAAACGGVSRLMPHLKTHRAPWIVKLLLENGVRQFKAATTAEIEMALAAGASSVTWAYPTANGHTISDFLLLARRYPDASLSAIVDSDYAWNLWAERLDETFDNVKLRVDLDPEFGRTGIAMTQAAVDLARKIAARHVLAGWHVYDGNIKGTIAERQAQVDKFAAKICNLTVQLGDCGASIDTIAGSSYTFDMWPADVAAFVSPGSWTYSSSQHDEELANLGWLPAAFVLATVISTHDGTATLDAGVKAIAPDKPMKTRFRWDGEILLMNEEHTVVTANVAVGERLLLLPQHACTTAYLYDTAMVYGRDGQWHKRGQLGSRRSYHTTLSKTEN
ncbi:alanine racemase [Rhizobium sp.]|jgi:D-serine deaminase-like pyridoxal phosphate-dependent protein|uniref:alanine racemase n=1 Tax=Rhizobium sp. TaxID=391 RepID=UPI0028AFC98F